jgi:hypothetical protein
MKLFHRVRLWSSKSRSPRLATRRPAFRPFLRMDHLEDRVLPSVTTVTQTPASMISDTAAGNVIGPVSVSKDGRFVVYTDTAANLAPNQSMSSKTVSDVFLYDRSLGTTTLVSRAFDATTSNMKTADGTSKNAMISADGKWIAYVSNSDNLINGETNTPDVYQLYLHGNSSGTSFTLSYAGQTTTIASNATATTIQTDLAAILPSGVTASVTGSTGQFTITVTGATTDVTFDGTNLSLTGSNSFTGGHNQFLCDQYQVYLYDVTQGTTTLVSHIAGSATTASDGANGILTGTEASDTSLASQTTSVSISGDGSYIVYVSSGVNLAAGQRAGPFDPAAPPLAAPAGVFVYSRTAGTNTLISRQDPTAAGNSTTEGDGTSLVAVIDQNGDTIAFNDWSDNLAPNERLNPADPVSSEIVQVYVAKIGTTGGWANATVQLASHDVGGNNIVSLTNVGGPPDYPAPVLTPDGHFMVYMTDNAILQNVAGGTTTGQGDNYYRYDTTTQNNILLTRQAGTTNVEANAAPSTFGGLGALLSGQNYTAPAAAISDNGQFIAFYSAATNLLSTTNLTATGYNPYLFNASTGTITLLNALLDNNHKSIPTSSFPAGNYPPLTVAISGDGTDVAFIGFASSDISGLTNDNTLPGTKGMDALVFNSSNSSYTLLSHSFVSATTTGNGEAYSVAFSDDGSKSTVLYLDDSTNLLPSTVSGHSGQDLNASIPENRTDPLTYNALGTDLYAYSLNTPSGYTPVAGNGLSGSSAPLGTNSTVTLKDPAQTSESLTVNGQSEVSPIHAVSDDGNLTVFMSNAPNLVAGELDPSLTLNVYLYNKTANTVTLLSHVAGTGTAALTTGDHDSTNAVISGDGKTVLFYSFATNLISGESFAGTAGQDAELYLYNVTTGTLSLVSHTPSNPTQAANGTLPGLPKGTSGNNTLLYSSSQTANGLALPSVSDNGQFIAYISNATDLSGSNTGAATLNAFLYDRAADTNTMITHASGATTTANGATDTVAISSDGSTVAFTTKATNLLASTVPNNNGDQLYVWSRTSGQPPVLASHSASSTTTAATFGTGTATSPWGPLPPSLSSDGAFVAYYFGGNNLVTGQAGTASATNVFRYDVVHNTNLLVSHSNSSASTSGDNPTNSNEYEASGPAISANGEFIAYANNSTNLLVSTLTGQNGKDNVYLFDANQSDVTKQNVLVSNSGTANTPDQNGGTSPSITADGVFVSFIDLAPEDSADPNCTFTKAISHVVLYDSQPGSTQLTTMGDVSDIKTILDIRSTLAATNLSANYAANSLPTVAWFGSSTGNGSQDLNGNTDVFVNAPSSSSSGSLTLTASNITGLENTAGSFTVARIDDTVSTDTASMFTATIDWGDSTPQTTATITGSTGGPFFVTGTHTYREEGTYNLIVTLTAVPSGDTAPQPVHPTATIADVPLTGNGGFTLTGLEGAAIAPTTVATFTDPVWTSLETSADYSATIDWGDGTALTTGTISGSNGSFTVSGGHTYFEESAADHANSNPYTITVRIHHGDADGAASPDLVVTNTATITDQAVTATGGFTLTGLEGAAIAPTTVAMFTDPGDPNGNVEPLADYTASINWGDGMTTVGTITRVSGNSFRVTGGHTYTEESAADHPNSNPYNIIVTITHESTTPTVVTSTATITDQAVTATGGFALTGVEGTAIAPTTVATFTDPGDPNGNVEPLADYTAMINWGDGHSTTGTITRVSGNSFKVTGGHTYSEESAADHPNSNPYTITVTITHESTTPTVVTSTATISDPPVSGQGVSALTGVENTKIPGQALATFTDPGGAEALGDYSATIDWGDNTPTSTGTISVSGGTFTVTGPDHIYVDEGNFTIKVTIKHESATPDAVVSDSVTITDPSVVGSGQGFNAVEGMKFTGQAVATFTDPPGAEPLADYSASINWGDNTSSAGTITVAGGTFTVAGDHTYAEEGKFTVTVTIHHDHAPDTTVTATATVSDPPVQGSGHDFAGVEGHKLSGQTVATFTDPGGPEVVSDYTATIDWGDNSGTSTGTIVNNGGTFTVTGDHTYAEEGKFTVTVTLHHDSATPDQTVTSTATISDPSVTGTPVNITGIEGIKLSGQTVATFTDPGGPEALGDYSATINWGDNSSGAGTITFSGGTFTVKGDHTYAEEGKFTVTVTLHHDSATDTTVQATATISDPSVLGTPGAPVSGVEGTKFSGLVVATFTDPGGAEPLGDYSATINWGDGTSGPGTISNGFTVTGDHTYAEEGKFTITVLLHHDTALDTSVSTTATISDPAVNATAGPGGTAIEGIKTTVNLGTFTDPGGPETPSDYSATINWGDGTSSAGTASGPDGSGGFTVSGDHTYAEEGKFTATVIVHHDSAPDSQFSVTVTVSDPSVLGGGVNFSATAGVPFTGQVVANFSDPGGPEVIGDYSATIDWGDGSGTSPATIAPAAGGTFTAAGDHTYAKPGKYTVTVTIHHDSAPDTVVTGTATVAGPGVTATGVIINSTEGAPISQAVATFTDPGGTDILANYSATINWGDGTGVVAGTISGPDGSGVFTVSGSHTYVEEGNYTITITIKHQGAADTTVTSTALVADPAVVGNGTTIDLRGSATVTNVAVATFTDPGGPEVLTDYSATINWGDGSGIDAGSISGPDGNGVFTVSGSHTFPSQSKFNVVITVLHEGTSTAINSAAGVSFNHVPGVSPGAQNTINNIFVSLLGRIADTTALSGFGSLLDQGAATPTQVAQAVVQSPEYKTDVVEAAYDRLLHRAADPSGLAAWVGFLSTGGTERQMEMFITSSPEFFQRQGGGTNTGFLSALFTDVFNRSIDPGSLQSFLNSMAQGTTQLQVVTVVLSSEEFYTDLVESYYQRFLHRNVDASLPAWVAALQAGLPADQFLADILASTEFQKMV